MKVTSGRAYEQVVKVNINTDIKEAERADGDWMHAAQDTDQQWAFLKTVTKFRVPQKWRISSVAEKIQ